MKHAFALSCLIVVGACGSSSSSDGPEDPDAGETPAAVCSWNEEPEALPLPEGSVEGVLAGEGKNRSTTCTTSSGTGGPDAVYKLELQERRKVHLAVRSTMNTAIAIRRVCEDPLTEVACGSVPLQNGQQIGPPGSLLAFAQRPTVDAELESVLDAGTYFVVVDEEAAFGVGGKFTLEVATSDPPVGLFCDLSEHLESRDTRSQQRVNDEDPPVADCGTRVFNARFYNLTIPPGEQLTATATPRGGDQSWQPVLQLQGSCDEGSCLGADLTSSPFSAAKSLRFTNNGTEPLDVILVVGANTQLINGAFDLKVIVGRPQLNTNCRAATRVRDGQKLRKEIITSADPVTSTCVSSGPMRGHYYQAEVPAGHTLNVNYIPANKGPSPSFLLLRSGNCSNGVQCDPPTQPGKLVFKNNDLKPVVVTFVVAMPSFGGDDIIDVEFGLDISISPPPGQVEVINRQPVLFTSENGEAATFQVRLSNAPSSPVTVPLASSNGAEGAVTPSALVFTPSNWDKPQIVIVLPVDDQKRDGPQNYLAKILPATGDRAFAGFDAEDVAITNRDNEVGINVRRMGSLTTNEAGATEQVPVQLNVASKGVVRIKVSASKPSEATVAPAELEFNALNWNVDQVVLITGIDDNILDGDQPYRVRFEVASSTDPAFSSDVVVELEAINRERAFTEQRPAVIPMPAGASFDCSLGFSRWDRRIAADSRGVLYVALVCAAAADRPGPTPSGTIVAGQSQVFVAISRNGGATFAEPVPLPLFGASNITLASGEGGVVYVGASTDAGPALVRTADGVTWSERTSVALDTAGFSTVLAAGKSVLFAQSTSQRAQFWRNETLGEGAFPFVEEASITTPFAVFNDSNGQDFWMINGGAVRMAKGGTTSWTTTAAGGFSDSTLEQFATGGNVVWAVGPQPVLLRQNLSKDEKTAQSIPLRSGFMFGRSLSAANDGSVTLFETGADRSLRARHFASNGSEDRSPKGLVPTAGATSVQTLGGTATAYTYAVGKEQFFGVLVW